MATNPSVFATKLLNQPYPTLNLAPSSVIQRAGGVRIVDGGGTVGKTNWERWAQIAKSIPFPLPIKLPGTDKAAAFVAAKTAEGAQAVGDKVKSGIDTAKQAVESTVNLVKILLVAVVVVGSIILLGQAKLSLNALRT